MYQMKKLVLAMATAGMFSLASFHAQAAETDMNAQLTEVTQEGKVWTLIALDNHLNPFGIDIEITDGTATLTGSVASDVERDLVGQFTQGTQGVHTVDNQLTVSPPEADELNQPRLSEQVDDTTLTAMIKSKLLWNSNTEGLDINVTTAQAVVTLKGNPNSDEAMQLAEQIASNTKGVKQVNNQLKLSPTGPGTPEEQQVTGNVINDGWITSTVKSSFLYDKILDGLDIDVVTERGMVHLSGDVLDAAEKHQAIETARNTRGVRGVNASALRVAT